MQHAMKVRATIRAEQVVDVELDAEAAAHWFWSVNDEVQADFFVALERIAREDCARKNSTPDMQWLYMTGHLKTCSCSNEQTREMLRGWGEMLADPAQ